jgi:hypothetical protein
MVRHRLLESVAPQLWCLLQGFYECVPRPLLQIFDYEELDLLLSGLPSALPFFWDLLSARAFALTLAPLVVFIVMPALPPPLSRACV